MNKPANSFGTRLRWWRERRALSQLDLALEADTSQRHLSFLESGRAAPSREMVLRLGATLGLPLRQQNALLLAAGFAPAWRESQLDAPQLALVQSALDHMLKHHEPYPALVVDRTWNLLRANRGAAMLTSFLNGPAEPPPGPVNLADVLLSPDGWRPLIENWHEVALYFLRDVQADAFADPSAEAEALLGRLLAYPDVPNLSRAPLIEEAPLPVLPVQFRKGDISIRLFTTIATLGTPRDVTLQGIRIETLFPADEPTSALLRSWGG
ncbi:MAG: helix-turn-helix transcriptional regulator [Alphaproteobacteria bacterium]|nr:helix-turn-helix transcriptional regulator [Alphaproteobacteria bacterium]